MRLNALYPSTQSSYRQYHSTETALLKVKNYILMNMSHLVLLNLSAAFDAVDHSIGQVLVSVAPPWPGSDHTYATDHSAS